MHSNSISHVLTQHSLSLCRNSKFFFCSLSRFQCDTHRYRGHWVSELNWIAHSYCEQFNYSNRLTHSLVRCYLPCYRTTTTRNTLFSHYQKKMPKNWQCLFRSFLSWHLLKSFFFLPQRIRCHCHFNSLSIKRYNVNFSPQGFEWFVGRWKTFC